MTALFEATDPCFLPLGLERRPARAGVDYGGTLRGRAVTAHCSRRARTRYAGEVRHRVYTGHQVELTATTPLKTRLAIAPPSTAGAALARQINGWMGAEPVTGLGPAYDHLMVYAATPDWARSLLTQPGVPDLVRTLVPPGTEDPLEAVKLSPGAWTFARRAPLDTLTPDRVQAWTEALLDLADRAEALEAPPVVELKGWEAALKERPERAVLSVVAGCFGALILFGIASALLVWALT